MWIVKIVEVVEGIGAMIELATCACHAQFYKAACVGHTFPVISIGSIEDCIALILLMLT